MPSSSGRSVHEHPRSPRRRLRVAALAAIVVVSALLAPGCSTPARVRTPERYRSGLILVLPGIEGRSIFNRNIVLGLEDGGVHSAMEVFDWTYRVPGLNVLNLTDVDRNRRQARRLAQRIVQYRQKYPAGAVHVVAHSGGAGVAVFALEALPPEGRIDQLLLLAPALSPAYDLTAALKRTRVGIANFYSQRDIGLLVVGTSVFGTVDRDRRASAGAVGFEIPPGATAADRQLYASKLRQVRWTLRLLEKGATGTHVGWTSQRFAREYLAPMVRENERSRLQPPPTTSPATAPNAE